MTEVTSDEAAAYAADSAPAVSTHNVLGAITNVVRELITARKDVRQLEEQLKGAQSRVRVLEEVTLPELMREAGQEKLRTADGWDVELDEVLRASVPEANLAEAVTWLTAGGYGSIVKRELKLSFGKNETDQAQTALNVICEAGFVPSDKQSIHPQTLASSIREMVAAGIDVPLGLLGAYVQPRVKVKEGKRKEGKRK